MNPNPIRHTVTVVRYSRLLTGSTYSTLSAYYHPQQLPAGRQRRTKPRLQFSRNQVKERGMFSRHWLALMSPLGQFAVQCVHVALPDKVPSTRGTGASIRHAINDSHRHVGPGSSPVLYDLRSQIHQTGWPHSDSMGRSIKNALSAGDLANMFHYGSLAQQIGTRVSHRPGCVCLGDRGRSGAISSPRCRDPFHIRIYIRCRTSRLSNLQFDSPLAHDQPTNRTSCLRLSLIRLHRKPPFKFCARAPSPIGRRGKAEQRP
jgi:hypothetical protein